jgi:phosphoribosylaminoimidazole-succinocarboxamide synthase
MRAVIETEIAKRKPDYRGKVRDVYDYDDKLLIISTDRLSAFDRILSSPIPERGILLTKISSLWFEKTSHIIGNHIITTDINEMAEFGVSGDLSPYEGRSMLVHKADRVDIECIVRGFITGGGFKEYKRTGAVSGIFLPEGLSDGDILSEPVFTPTTKADEGHDEPISFDALSDKIGLELAQKLRDLTIGLYLFARDYAKERGFIIVDTKLEFGYKDGELILIDEIFTPDSSRFWLLSDYEKGVRDSFDKQLVRDFLTKTGYNGEGEPPEISDEVIEMTRLRYKTILDMLS